MLHERDTIIEFTGRRTKAFSLCIGSETAIFYNGGRYGAWREAFPRSMANEIVRQYPASYRIIDDDVSKYPPQPFDTILESTDQDVPSKTIRVGNAVVTFSREYGEHGPWRAAVPSYVAYGYQALAPRIWHCCGNMSEVLPPVPFEEEQEEEEITISNQPRPPQHPRQENPTHRPVNVTPAAAVPQSNEDEEITPKFEEDGDDEEMVTAGQGDITGSVRPVRVRR